MVTINASPERNIRLGYAGEDKVTKVIFPYNESWLEYGDGEFFIRVLRPGDTEPYNAQDVTNDSEAMTLTLVVTDVELSKEGYGQMQVVYIGPQAVKKSPIYTYRVSKAIDEPVDPPDGSIINEVVRSLAELTDEVGDISKALEAKADKSYVDNELAKKVDDVQVDGTSIVTDGVANVPLASESTLGLLKLKNAFGTVITDDGSLAIVRAGSSEVKRGTSEYHPVSPMNQHLSAFYGLAKIAGVDERNSAFPAGTYSDEAKIAIQKMLGIYEAPWELINEETFTNETEADYVITTDANGNAFELTDLVLAFWLPKQSTLAKKGSYGHVSFMKNGADMVKTESGAWDQQANSSPRGFMISMEDHNGMVFVRQHVNTIGGYTASMTMRIPQNFNMTSAQPSIKFAGSDFYIDSINILAVTGTGQYRLYGKRKWT